MADPTTGNELFAIPNRGADSGTWDSPLNTNASAYDSLFGGQVTLAINAATTLTPTVPATGTVIPSANTVQSWNAAFKLSGTLTGGNSTIVLTLPRRYIIDATGLTTGTSCVVLAPATGTGTRCGVPWGRVSDFWFDGTNVKFIGLEHVGCYLEMAVATTPSWITQSSVPPYVLTDGSTYSTTLYPVLGGMLGSTFGGNGINTFGVPDTISRIVLSLDPAGTKGRVTTAGSGVDGATLGATGGDQRMQSHTHTATVGDIGHAHVEQFFNTASGSGQGPQDVAAGGSPTIGRNTGTSTTGITVTNANNGAGSSQNMPPAIVGGLRYIRAA